MERVSTPLLHLDSAIRQSTQTADVPARGRIVAGCQQRTRGMRLVASVFAAATVLGGATACGADGPLSSIMDEPEANQTLVNLFAEYQHVEGSPKLDADTKQLLEKQATQVRDEWIRLCGSDASGEAPEHCIAEAQADKVNVPDNFTLSSLNDSLVDAVVSSKQSGSSSTTSSTAPKDQPSPEILLNLAAEMAPAMDDFDSRKVTELDLTDYPKDLEAVRAAAHSGWFAAGLALAKDDGSNAPAIRDVRDTMQQLRDDLTAQAERINGEAPADLPAGFTLRDGIEAPTGPKDAVSFMEGVIPTVLEPLHEAALHSKAVDDRRYAATWFVYLTQQQAEL